MRGARCFGAFLIAVLVHRGLTYRIGKSLQRPQRTAYALVFLATDSSVEKDCHSGCTGHVDDVHCDDHLSCLLTVQDCWLRSVIPESTAAAGNANATPEQLRCHQNNAPAFTTPPGCRCSEWAHLMPACPMVQGGSTERNGPCKRYGREVEIREENVRERSAESFCMRISHHGVLAIGCRFMTMPSPSVNSLRLRGYRAFSSNLVRWTTPAAGLRTQSARATTCALNA